MCVGMRYALPLGNIKQSWIERARPIRHMRLTAWQCPPGRHVADEAWIGLELADQTFETIVGGHEVARTAPSRRRRTRGMETNATRTIPVRAT